MLFPPHFQKLVDFLRKLKNYPVPSGVFEGCCKLGIQILIHDNASISSSDQKIDDVLSFVVHHAAEAFSTFLDENETGVLISATAELIHSQTSRVIPAAASNTMPADVSVAIPATTDGATSVAGTVASEITTVGESLFSFSRQTKQK